VAASKVGVEVCLTSNYLTGMVSTLRSHPITEMIRRGLTVCLCADNTLVYATSLSREYARALAAGLTSPETLLDIAESAAAMTFLPISEREELQRRLSPDEKLKARLLTSLRSSLPAHVEL